MSASQTARALSPIELVDAIWEELPDFRESYELPDGMFRTKVAAFDEAVVRELLVNALVHRLVELAGRTKGTRYFVPPKLLRDAGLDHLTTLTRVQPHRLRALILEDLERFPDSSATDIHRRVGAEIPERTFRYPLEALITEVRKTTSSSWVRPAGAGTA